MSSAGISIQHRLIFRSNALLRFNLFLSFSMSSSAKDAACHDVDFAADTGPLPERPTAWAENITKYGHENSSLMSVKPKSASEASIEQFYVLRAL